MWIIFKNKAHKTAHPSDRGDFWDIAPKTLHFSISFLTFLLGAHLQPHEQQAIINSTAISIINITWLPRQDFVGWRREDSGQVRMISVNNIMSEGDCMMSQMSHCDLCGASSGIGWAGKGVGLRAGALWLHSFCWVASSPCPQHLLCPSPVHRVSSIDSHLTAYICLLYPEAAKEAEKHQAGLWRETLKFGSL